MIPYVKYDTPITLCGQEILDTLKARVATSLKKLVLKVLVLIERE